MADPIRREKSCENPQCVRMVPVGVLYCCGPCNWSHQQAKDGAALFAPHHSDRCNERQRGTAAEPQ